MTVRLAILLSGRGSNFLALHRAIEDGRVPNTEIACVLSNVEDAPGLAKARELGLHIEAVPHRGMKRRAHDTLVVEVLRRLRVDWVCLAGYMRLLTPVFVQAFPRRIVNIHPSLLPSFPGLDAQQQAFDYGVRVSGCTVHLVDEGMDTGPIVDQECVDISGCRTAEQAASLILAKEHDLYPRALASLLAGKWHVDGRRVILNERILER